MPWRFSTASTHTLQHGDHFAVVMALLADVHAVVNRFGHDAEPPRLVDHVVGLPALLVDGMAVHLHVIQRFFGVGLP